MLWDLPVLVVLLVAGVALLHRPTRLFLDAPRIAHVAAGGDDGRHGLLGDDEQVAAALADEPLAVPLAAGGATAARAGHGRRGRRVDGQREQVGRLREVGDEAAVEDEVDEAQDVGQEGEDEDEEEELLRLARRARGVDALAEGGVEVDGFRGEEDGFLVVLYQRERVNCCFKVV